jgi:imidazolonepropionase-like amidohydrolase
MLDVTNSDRVAGLAHSQCGSTAGPPVPHRLARHGRVAAHILMLAGAVLPLARPVHAQADSAPLVILHATVINPGVQSVRPDQVVVVRRNHIATVADASGFVIPDHARVIDATGRFLIPGLWDMHVHSAFGDWFPHGRDVILPLYVANGVTGVRDMGGDIPVLFSWRKEITAGTLIGPRMVVSGPMLDGYLPDGKSLRFPSSIPVTGVTDAVAAVRSLAGQHVDFIKVQSEVPHDAYLAAAAEAHRVGLPIVGHVPTRVRIREVIAAGQKSIEHLMGIFEGCSTQEDRFVAGTGSMQLLLASYDAPRCDALIRRLAKAQVWQVPTLAWQRGETLLDLLDQQHQPLARYVPAYWRNVSWRRFTDGIMTDIRKDPLARRQEYWHRNLTMVGALHHAGVPILAGTDAAPGVYILPGFSLHDELAEMVAAGLSPMEALQTATSNPARFLMRDDIGKIAPGAVADLVLLSADPVADIHNTTAIQAVVANGRIFDRAGLDDLLHQVEAAAQASQ